MTAVLSTFLLVTPGLAKPLESSADLGPGRRCQADQSLVADLVRALISAEDRHDLSAVRSFVWDSPNTLFVAKTATPQEGNWAGFWGTNVVMQHFHDLYRGTFHMAPAYGRERLAALSCGVVEVYLPVAISVAYGGQNPAPKPFILVLDWVQTSSGWRMATDVALPIPPAPQAHQ